MLPDATAWHADIHTAWPVGQIGPDMRQTLNEIFISLLRAMKFGPLSFAGLP